MKLKRPFTGILLTALVLLGQRLFPAHGEYLLLPFLVHSTYSMIE